MKTVNMVFCFIILQVIICAQYTVMKSMTCIMKDLAIGLYFFKGLALDYIIKLYPKTVGAFSIIPGGIIENNKRALFHIYHY